MIVVLPSKVRPEPKYEHLTIEQICERAEVVRDYQPRSCAEDESWLGFHVSFNNVRLCTIVETFHYYNYRYIVAFPKKYQLDYSWDGKFKELDEAINAGIRESIQRLLKNRNKINSKLKALGLERL